MSSTLLTVSYLAAAMLFVLSLGGLSNPETSRRGNLYGMIGMAIAVLATVLGPHVTKAAYPWIVGAMLVGAVIGLYAARVVKMTQMPELVALMHSLVGLVAVLVGFANYIDPAASAGLEGAEKTVHELEIYIGVLIGAVTFSGSLIAFGKLSAKISGKPVLLPGRHWINLAGLLVVIWCCAWFINAQSIEEGLKPLAIMTLVALLFGVHMVMAIGGADMPVVVSMLNSYSGWAAAGIGFSLNNSMLIIAGSLVGSSGAILSYIMCKAMNRSFFNVILGGFGGEVGTAVAAQQQRPVKSGSPDDAAFLLTNADSVIIVPGYGLAVARAQHPLKELTDKLIERGINVKYAIHPVAGRMPGHMNVLLAEAEVPYDQVFEMEDVNSEFGDTDVVLVLGANDVVNPAAKDPKSPIAGMPILEAYKARQVIVNKRSMASGYAGLDNELFYMDKTMMVFGDAKKIIEDIVKASAH
jgi:H+-translocating NAD(P) transhydrogenase subunit beta